MKARPFSPAEILFLALLFAAPLGIFLRAVPEQGLYAVIAFSLYGVPAGGLIIAVMRRGRVRR